MPNPITVQDAESTATRKIVFGIFGKTVLSFFHLVKLTGGGQR